MQTWRGYADDPLGHRLLVQLTEERTEAEAREALVRIFGRRKGEAAVLVAGSMQPSSVWSNKVMRPLSSQSSQWTARADGFRAYLPW